METTYTLDMKLYYNRSDLFSISFFFSLTKHFITVLSFSQVPSVKKLLNLVHAGIFSDSTIILNAAEDFSRLV